MNIAFFLSDHGYGHLNRNLPVIKELSKRGHNVYLICGEKHCKLARDYLPSIVAIPFHTDVGLILQEKSLLIDKDRTASAVYEYMDRWDEKVKFGNNVINKYLIDKVVVDIVPWALISAKQMNKTSFFMASFTWVEQYEDFIKKEYLELLKKAFCSATYNLFYALINGHTKKLLKKGIDVGFVCREFDDNKVSEIKKKHKNKIVTILLGGSETELFENVDVNSLHYDFIVSDNVKLIGNNVYRIGADSNNYIKASDICIAKAGWSTISEIIISKSRFAVIERNGVAEDTILIEKITKNRMGLCFSLKEIEDFKKTISEIEKSNFSTNHFANNYIKVSDIIEFK